MTWKITYTAQAKKDAKKVTPHCKKKLLELINLLTQDPFQTPPSYEALLGTLKGTYSRRINIQHRLVYEVLSESKVIKVLSMWSHYE